MNPPVKKKNKDTRVREYLTIQEVEKLRSAAKKDAQYAHRNDTIILMMFRHGLRVGEVVKLRWDQIDLTQGFIHVNRLKKGLAAVHPLDHVTIRAINRLKKLYAATESEYVFVKHNTCIPLSVRTIHHIISKAGQTAGFSFPVHPHMLRHGTGFYLANKGIDTRAIQSYMGHSNINTTVIYTAMCANRFKNFWSD